MTHYTSLSVAEFHTMDDNAREGRSHPNSIFDVIVHAAKNRFMGCRSFSTNPPLCFQSTHKILIMQITVKKAIVISVGGVENLRITSPGQLLFKMPK